MILMTYIFVTTEIIGLLQPKLSEEPSFIANIDHLEVFGMWNLDLCGVSVS